MKKILIIAAFLIPSLGFSLSAAEKTEIKVYGACGMCEARIEKAAKIDGVSKAEWSQQTKMLTLEYDASKVNLDKIHQAIADAGHDTEKVTAKDETYNSLHACCHYERKAADKASAKPVGSSKPCCSNH